jgi:dipeptidyl aminopeptidase/acylaminoacyl peptidase
MFVQLRHLVSRALMCACVLASAHAFGEGFGVSVKDIVTRTRIPSFSISPDGERVAFVTIKADTRKDDYEITLHVGRMSYPSNPFPLAKYVLRPEEVYDSDTHLPYKTVSQYVWSSDSKRLLYTVHADRGMELRITRFDTGADRVLLQGHEGIQLEEPVGDFGWKAISFDQEDSQANFEPRDTALLVKEGFQPFLLTNPKTRPATIVRNWEVNWEGVQALELPSDAIPQYFNFADEYSWDGKELHLLPARRMPELAERGHVSAANQSQDQPEIVVDADAERSIVRLVQRGTSRTILEDEAILVPYYAESTDPRRRAYISNDGRVAVLLRSTNFMPDELVRLDVQTGKTAVLFSPNDIFHEKTEGLTVRLISAPPESGGLSGRLFLPRDYLKGEKYPLVFTTYLGTPGFYLSDEVPILTLLDYGIAVFALHATDVGKVLGRNGDLDAELLRVERPRQSMEWIVRRLANEGIIDPDRCGVSGLSYGSEISMYAYWRSTAFRAVSSTTASWGPMTYSMVGPAFATMLDDRGLLRPQDGTYGRWKRISASLNARPTLPPLLWQSPETERIGEMQPWQELRRAGAQVEWLEYPGEGHSKRHPANEWWVNQRNLDWFRFWLQDEQDPDPAKAEQYARWHEMRNRWETAKGKSDTRDLRTKPR